MSRERRILWSVDVRCPELPVFRYSTESSNCDDCFADESLELLIILLWHSSNYNNTLVLVKQMLPKRRKKKIVSTKCVVNSTNCFIIVAINWGHTPSPRPPTLNGTVGKKVGNVSVIYFPFQPINYIHRKNRSNSNSFLVWMVAELRELNKLKTALMQLIN